MRPIRPFSQRRRSARAGFTVIEVIVAMVGMLIVGGLVLEIYSETERAAQKMVRRQGAIDFSVSFLDQTSDLLRGAVHPANLDADAAAQFAPDRFSVPAYADPASNGLFLVSLRPVEEASEGQHYEIVREVLAGSAEAGSGSETVNPYGMALSDDKPEIAFRYATESSPGDPIAWRDRLNPGEWPVLVEIAVAIPFEDDESIRMRTAVIPGRMGPSAAVAPTPTPTPVPSAALQSGEAARTEEAGTPSPMPGVEDASTTEAAP